MRGHLQALATALAPLGYPVHMFYAHPLDDGSMQPVPYLVLGGAWGYGEEPVCGATDSLSAAVTVTCAASTAEGASVVAGRVGEHLSPGGAWTPVPMAGRKAEVRATGFTDPEVDRDVRLPNSNRHPGVAHVLLRMASDPVPDSSSSS